MTEKIEYKVGNPQKIKLKMGQVEPPLKIFLFLKVRFINFFLIPVAQTYQNESAPIFYYAKSKKYCWKLFKIAVLQPPDWIQRKKNTLYYLDISFISINYFQIEIKPPEFVFGQLRLQLPSSSRL